jgi:hypothetical protein
MCMFLQFQLWIACYFNLKEKYLKLKIAVSKYKTPTEKMLFIFKFVSQKMVIYYPPQMWL